MKKLAVLLAFALAAVSCSQTRSTEAVDDAAVITYKGETTEISGDLLEELTQAGIDYQLETATEEQAPSLEEIEEQRDVIRANTLTLMILNEVIEIELSQQGLELDEAAQEGAEEEVRSQQVGTPEELDQYFSTDNPFISTNRNLAAGLYALRQPIQESIEVADRVCISHILVSHTDDPELSEEENAAASEEARLKLVAARERIEGGEEFADVATEVSEDPGSGQNGGELGCAPTSTYVQSFAETAESSEEGELSEPFLSEFGWHFLVVTGTEAPTDQEIASEAQVELQNSLQTEIAAAEITVEESIGTWNAQALAVDPPVALEDTEATEQVSEADPAEEPEVVEEDADEDASETEETDG